VKGIFRRLYVIAILALRNFGGGPVEIRKEVRDDPCDLVEVRISTVDVRITKERTDPKTRCTEMGAVSPCMVTPAKRKKRSALCAQTYQDHPLVSTALISLAMAYSYEARTATS
jgi:bifunctional DNA-binding transcriptional regulator/antitoxin component of YhaV-PrlF toxin-antitoxin module